MKKLILSAICLMAVAALNAQTVNVHFKNGQVINYNSDNVDFVDFSAKAPDPTLTAGEVVDLGLSVYWASCNLGASKPEEYGDYYAWGETSPKANYTESTYSYYNSSTTEYMDIGSEISGTEYDAAHVNLGGDWRMPTKAEMQELINKCTWEWTQIEGVNGYKVTGPSGNSIFLPAAGRKTSYTINDASNASIDLTYWTSTLSSSKAKPYYLYGNSGTKSINTGMVILIYSGMSIRPVTTNPNGTGEQTDHSQDYLVTDKVSARFTGGAYSMVNNTIQSGSQLNWQFINNSTESVVLTGIQLINGTTGTVENNMLSENVTIAAGETKGYTTTVGAGGIQKPSIRFTYRYNNANYTAEATMSAPTF